MQLPNTQYNSETWWPTQSLKNDSCHRECSPRDYTSYKSNANEKHPGLRRCMSDLLSVHETDVVCSICLDSDIVHQGVTVQKCGHNFCSSCINDWTVNYFSQHENEDSAPCPKCFQKIDKLEDFNFNVCVPSEVDFKGWKLKDFGSGFDDSSVISRSKRFNRILYSGHFWKRGHLIKSWKKRYGILWKGNLDVYVIYFRSNSAKERVLGYAPLRHAYLRLRERDRTVLHDSILANPSKAKFEGRQIDSSSRNSQYGLTLCIESSSNGELLDTDCHSRYEIAFDSEHALQLWTYFFNMAFLHSNLLDFFIEFYPQKITDFDNLCENIKYAYMGDESGIWKKLRQSRSSRSSSV